jgi:hypothetical protein
VASEQLACRLCHFPLTSDAGCAGCLPVKANLVVVSAIDEDAVPLAVVAAEAVGLLRKQLKMAKATQDKSSQYDPILGQETRSITNAIAKLLDSSRKLVEDGANAVEAMSFQEKAALFLEWTGTLPGPYRRRLIDQMATQGADPLKEQPSHDHVSVN